MADSVQFYVDDTSPTVSYYPFADTLDLPNLQAGWNPYFSISGFATAPGETGNGTSFHITALNGAILSLHFNGTGIQLIGNATNASYSLTLDGALTQPNSSSQADNILASFHDLSNSPHSLSLTAITSSTSSFIAFDKALVTAPPPNQNLSIPSTFPTQTIPDDNVAFLGKWSFENNTLGSNSTSFHQSTTAGDRARVSFTGTSLLLTGLTSPNCGQYSVTVDNDTATTRTLSARSSFVQPDALLYFASGLDPQTTHALEVQNLDGNTLALKLGGFEVVTQNASTTSPCPPGSSGPPAPPPHQNTKTYSGGTIAALVLGGILVVLIFAGGLFYFMNRRPRRMRRRREREFRTKLVRDSMVLDIRGGGQRWDDGPTDSLGHHERSRALDLGADAEKVEVHDLSKLSPIAFIAGSVKSEAKSKSSRGWMGSIISRSRSKGKGKNKHKYKGQGNQSQSQSSFPSTSYTIDLQLTPPQRSSQGLTPSHSGSHSDDPLSPPSLSTLPNLQYITTTTAAPEPLPISSASTSSEPYVPSRASSPMPPPHKHPAFPERVQTGSSRALLHSGLPNLASPDSDSSIEYLDVAGGEYVDEYEVDGIRGLSPRTSEVVDRRKSVLGSAVPLLVDVVERGEPSAEKPGDEIKVGENVADEDFLNNIIDTSPFRVDFAERLHRASGKSGSSHVRFQDLEEFGQKTKEPVPQINVEPKFQHPGVRISFLDFGATSSSSLPIDSGSSVSLPNPNVSRWSSTTVPSTRASLPSVGSHDPHTTTSSTPSFPFPFPMSMPPPQDQPSSNQPRAHDQPPQASPQLQLPVGRHPQSDLDAAPSPTDSVPMSVSDILFRQSVSDDGSRRASTGSRLLPPHPPLPGLPPLGESEFSLSQSSGSPSPEPQGAPNPLGNSSFIVQRVLGVGVPVLSSPISQDHIRGSGSPSTSVIAPFPAGREDGRY